MRRWMPGLLGMLALAACGGGGDAPYLFSLERMLDQAKVDPYERSDLFSDGLAMRVPPAGAVAHREDAERPEVRSGRSGDAYVTRVPIELTRPDLERGGERFGIYCAVCHGHEGDGVSEVAQRMLLRPPPSLLTDRVRSLSAGRVFETISHGYGLMPEYRDALSVRDRWRVVAWVEVLQLRAGVRIEELPAATARRVREALGSSG